MLVCLKNVIIASGLALAVSCVRPALAAEEPATQSVVNETFAFNIPWTDATAGTATDLSFLNAKPAGVNGRIIVRDGHFVESGTGRRVRFLGTNMAMRENFPDHQDAEIIAAHLAKSGVNVIRLHHLDFTVNLKKWNDETLIDGRHPDRQHIHPDKLDRLEYLIAQLKKQGIYVNVNLRVSRELTPADGMPETITKIPYTLQKRVDRFNARWIELQKKYARDLLTHVNPYTGLSLVDDPAVMTVEINNENSIASPDGMILANMPEPFRGDLKQKWNQWLLSRHRDRTTLAAAWNQGIVAPGESILNSRNHWTKENQGASQATFDVDSSHPQKKTAPDVEIDVQKAGAMDWHVQMHLPGLTLENNSFYTWSFRMKSQLPRKIRINVTLDVEDWHTCGLDRTVEIGTEWKDYQFPFIARNTLKGHVRLAYLLGDHAGKISIADVRLQPGGGQGLESNESPADGTVEIAQPGSRRRMMDWVDFLADLDRSYADEMRAFLIRDLGVKAPIIDTQIPYGGLTGMHREAEMDFVDTHAYWQHPQFTGKEWGGAWYVQNKSQTLAIATNEMNELRRIASQRVEGKPHSVSEYDHPWPNIYAVEMMPSLAAFAALQDWDALYTFCHGPYGKNTPDRIGGWFDQINHPGKWGFYPSAAMLFRAGLIAPAPQLLMVQLSEKPWHKAAGSGEAWDAVLTEPWNTVMLSHRLAISRQYLPEGQRFRMIRQNSNTSSGSIVRTLSTAKGFALVAHSPSAAVIVGQIANQRTTAGALTFEAKNLRHDFGAVTLVTLDEKPVADSSRLLLTLGSHFANTGQQIPKTGGTGPVLADAITARVECRTSGLRTVYALDAKGTRGEKLPATWNNGLLRFDISPAHKTMFYELIAQ